METQILIRKLFQLCESMLVLVRYISIDYSLTYKGAVPHVTIDFPATIDRWTRLFV